MAEAFSDEELKELEQTIDNYRLVYHVEELKRLLATITADRREMAMCHKRIEELEISIKIQKAEYDDHEKTWFQIIESWTNQHPVSQREALRFLEKYAVKKKEQIRDQTAEIERLRGALEQIAAFNDEAANDYLEKYSKYAAFDEPDSVQIARQALDAGKE